MTSARIVITPGFLRIYRAVDNINFQDHRNLGIIQSNSQGKQVFLDSYLSVDRHMQGLTPSLPGYVQQRRLLL